MQVKHGRYNYPGWQSAALPWRACSSAQSSSAFWPHTTIATEPCIYYKIGQGCHSIVLKGRKLRRSGRLANLLRSMNAPSPIQMSRRHPFRAGASAHLLHQVFEAFSPYPTAPVFGFAILVIAGTHHYALYAIATGNGAVFLVLKGYL